ncbi:IS4 family transposase [Streptomyces sp. NPDC056227]|uniref:IS4 family transposase n=1 Tax=Streptomyces sp. NPDC056227 TaxID=3345753 RepID=UPI0035DF2CDB
MAGVPAAADVYAPGHIGELTQVVPFELVDAVLEDSRAVQQRVRALPSRVGVYFVLALGLFEHLGARLVWGKLVAGLNSTVPSPSEKALRDLRRRIGVAPVKRLFDTLAGPLAQPSTPGVRYRRWRTVAFDGCSSIPAPAHERNISWLGRITHRLGLAGYPRLMLMTLCETGTRGLLAAAFGPVRRESECAYARRLVDRITTDMLLLADRGFDSNELLRDIAGRGAQFLVRCKTTRNPPVLTLLPDGSYLTRIAGLEVRIIEGEIRAHTADGATTGDTYRLLTTLTDYRTDPADQLLRLYHERWEVESAYLALRHTLLKGRVLRSKDPMGITQELWALLALYQALRSAMVTAIETVPALDPDRASFTAALEAARDTVVIASGLVPTTVDDRVDLAGHIGAHVLGHLLPPRRPRISARIVKRGISRYHTWNRDDRPRSSSPVTAINITITPPALPTSPASTSTRPGRWSDVCQLMASEPPRPWRAQEIADRLGLTTPTPVRSLVSQLGTWTRRGLLIRTAPNTYKLILPDTLKLAGSP